MKQMKQADFKSTRLACDSVRSAGKPHPGACSELVEETYAGVVGQLAVLRAP